MASVLTPVRSDGYRRVGLGLVLLAAAVPYRYYGSFPLVASVSVLDVALLLTGAGLIARRVMLGRLDVGDRRLFHLLCVLPVLSLVSIVWTDDLGATARETFSYGEAVLAYVVVVQQCVGASPERIMLWLRRFLYAVLVPCVFLLLHVPGFAPQAPGVKHSAGDYLSFYSRFSHPFIGRSNNLATVLLLLIVPLVYWAVTRHHRPSYVAAAVCVVAIGLTLSRGAIGALVLTVVAVVVQRRWARGAQVRRRLRRLVGALLLTVAAAGWVFYLLNPDTNQFIGGRLSLSNVLLRESRLAHGFDRLVDRPLLGYGSGTLPGNDATITGGVHDTYLQQLLAFGVVLGVIGVISLLEVARFFLHGGARGLRGAVGLTVVALLIDIAGEASFEGQALRVIIYLLLGLLVGLVRAAEAAPTTPAAPEPAAATLGTRDG